MELGIWIGDFILIQITGRMKRILTVLAGIFLFLAMPGPILGQERPADLRPATDIFKNFSGYKDDDGKYRFEGEGYNIVITPHPRRAIAANYIEVADGLKGDQKIITNTLNNKPLENYVTDESLLKEHPPIYGRHYLIMAKDSTILDVSIARYEAFNTFFVNEMVNSIFYDGIYAPLLVDTKNDIIDFAGRKIKFEGDCYWLKPHEVKCTHTGEVTWHLFNSMADAEAFKQMEMWMLRKEMKRKIRDTELVKISFEKVPVTANRYLFESNELSLIYTENRLVNAYYITAEVRGRYLYCRLIFSDIATRDADPETGLPPLIAKFMKFR